MRFVGLRNEQTYSRRENSRGAGSDTGETQGRGKEGKEKRREGKGRVGKGREEKEREEKGD